MLVPIAKQGICRSCSSQVLLLFVNGFSSTARLPRHGSKAWSQYGRALQPPPIRSIATSRRSKASVEHDDLHQNEGLKTSAQMEAIVRQARQTFGETLPKDFLSTEEYVIYERLYGPPSATTLPEDVDLLKGVEEVEVEVPENVLMRENAEGNLEEVIFEEEEIEENGEYEMHELEMEPLKGSSNKDFNARMAVLREIAAAQTSELKRQKEEAGLVQDKENEEVEDEEILEEQSMYEEGFEDLEEADSADAGSDSLRTHPLTAAGRSGTSPATIQISKETMVDPITALLSDASNKQLAEVARKTFGGPGLPNSTATLARAHLKQQPIALEASQFKMGEMEGNAYMAAVMPGIYATVMNTLVEVRKRLGSEWLRELIEREDGPRVLDAGGGGAGILAWREVLRAEWNAMHPRGAHQDKRIPHGKSTVVTGSAALRNRASHLLDDTIFIPRLPDYEPSRDHPSLETNNPQPRKQYDVIIAPHTLWSLKEDYMRKNQIQNFWSLLDPKGGVLILLEKGVPRGFELIAGARETLLKYHVSSPGSDVVEHTVEDASENRFGPKEKGMIIAPCTNHGKCPMYITAGKSQGRKDYCHFSQRYIRPPYLQRILGGHDKNHEDILFSYVALQRGVDQREAAHVIQGETATNRAFVGYEDPCFEEQTFNRESVNEVVSSLSWPRAILSPIKRRGHVTLDLCTPAGKIERWTVPKSFSKQAYRDARKSRWGDLWALGAKTRVQRNIRVGLKKEKAQNEDISEAAAAEERPRPKKGQPGYTGWVERLKKRKQRRNEPFDVNDPKEPRYQQRLKNKEKYMRREFRRDPDA